MAARLLANELRRLRGVAGLSQSDVAEELGCATSRIGHLETQRNQIRRSDLIVMLMLYDVPRERHDWYLDLADKSREKGWWDGDRSIPHWFSSFVGLEWGATEVRNFEMGVVPGLLQVADYIAAMYRGDRARSDADVRMYLDQRLARQRALDRDDSPLMLHAIMDETALRRQVGGIAVLHEQLRHLVTMAEHPQVTIQVIPFSAGDHRSMEGGFHLLDFDAPFDPGLVYVETKRGGLYMEEPEEIALYQGVFESLMCTALSPAASVAMIDHMATELTTV